VPDIKKLEERIQTLHKIVIEHQKALAEVAVYQYPRGARQYIQEAEDLLKDLVSTEEESNG